MTPSAPPGPGNAKDCSPRVLLRELLDLVLPRTCPGCGGPEPWCATCAATISGRPRRVLPPIGQDAVQGCPPLYALARYRGPVRGAVIAGKEHGRRDLPDLLAPSLAAGVARLLRIGVVDQPLWLVPAPTRTAAARRRGGDPVRRIAEGAALELAERGLPCGVAPCLTTRRGAQDSVGLDAGDRMRNLTGGIRWNAAAAPPPSQSVLLIDDVLTTGATATCSAAVLATHGHPVSAVLVFASVPELR